MSKIEYLEKRLFATEQTLIGLINIVSASKIKYGNLTEEIKKARPRE